MAIKRSQNEQRNAASYHDCRICTLLCVILRIMFPVRAPHGGLGKFGWCNTRQAFRAAKGLALGSQSSALLCAIPPGHSRQPRPTRLPIGIPIPFIRVSLMVLDVFFPHAPTARMRDPVIQ